MTHGSQTLQFKRARRALYRTVPFPQLGNWAYSRSHRKIDKAWENAPYFLLHVPKCAGTSVVNALRLPDPGHLLVTDLEPDSKAMLSGKPALIVVRNPFDRIISAFRYAHSLHLQGKISYLLNISTYSDINQWVKIRLEEYVNSKHYFFRSTASYIRSAQENGMSVHAVPMDNLDRAFSNFHDSMTGSPLSLPFSNASSREIDVISELDKSSRTLITSIFPDDFSVYDTVSRSNIDGIKVV